MKVLVSFERIKYQENSNVDGISAMGHKSGGAYNPGLW